MCRATSNPQAPRDNQQIGINTIPNTSSLSKKARVAIFTTVGSVAVNTALKVIENRDDLEVACVVTCSGPKSIRSKACIDVAQCLFDYDPNIDIIVSNKKTRYAALMEAYDVDLVLSCIFPWLLPKSLVNNTNIRYGCINLHPSDLPKYRGPNPLGWAILNGDGEIHVTVHRMDSSFDTGATLAQTTFPLDVNDSIFDIIKNGEGAFISAMDQAITKALSGDPGIPQVEAKASQATRFDPDLRILDFERSALDVHNTVRAWSRQPGYSPGAIAQIKTKDGATRCIRIIKTHYDPALVSEDTENPSNDDLPGTITKREIKSRTFNIQCANGCLKVLEWEIDSES